MQKEMAEGTSTAAGLPGGRALKKGKHERRRAKKSRKTYGKEDLEN